LVDNLILGREDKITVSSFQPIIIIDYRCAYFISIYRYHNINSGNINITLISLSCPADIK